LWSFQLFSSASVLSLLFLTFAVERTLQHNKPHLAASWFPPPFGSIEHSSFFRFPLSSFPLTVRATPGLSPLFSDNAFLGDTFLCSYWLIFFLSGTSFGVLLVVYRVFNTKTLFDFHGAFSSAWPWRQFNQHVVFLLLPFSITPHSFWSLFLYCSDPWFQVRNLFTSFCLRTLDCLHCPLLYNSPLSIAYPPRCMIFSIYFNTFFSWTLPLMEHVLKSTIQHCEDLQDFFFSAYNFFLRNLFLHLPFVSGLPHHTKPYPFPRC